MSAPETQREDGAGESPVEEVPENLPPNAWLTFGLFAVFVVGLGSCMTLWMFN